MNKGDILSIIPVFDKYSFDSTDDERSLPALRALPKVMDGVLTPRQAEIVRMKYYEGLPQVEISRRLGIAPSVVSRHLASARRKIGRTVKALL